MANIFTRFGPHRPHVPRHVFARTHRPLHGSTVRPRALMTVNKPQPDHFVQAQTAVTIDRTRAQALTPRMRTAGLQSLPQEKARPLAKTRNPSEIIQNVPRVMDFNMNSGLAGIWSLFEKAHDRWKYFSGITGEEKQALRDFARELGLADGIDIDELPSGHIVRYLERCLDDFREFKQTNPGFSSPDEVMEMRTWKLIGYQYRRLFSPFLADRRAPTSFLRYRPLSNLYEEALGKIKAHEGINFIRDEEIKNVYFSPSAFDRNLWSVAYDGKRTPYGVDLFGKHVMQQFGIGGAVKAAVAMLILDNNGDETHLSLTWESGQIRNAQELIDQAGLLPMLITGMSLEKAIRRFGTLMIKLGGELGSHVVLLDDLSLEQNKARIRDPFHGWTIETTATAILFRQPAEFIAVQRIGPGGAYLREFPGLIEPNTSPDPRSKNPWISFSLGKAHVVPQLGQTDGMYFVVQNQISGTLGLSNQPRADEQVIAYLIRRKKILHIQTPDSAPMLVLEGIHYDLGLDRWLMLNPPILEPAEREIKEHPPMGAGARRSFFRGTGLESMVTASDFDPLALLMSLNAGDGFEIQSLLQFLRYEVKGGRLEAGKLRQAEEWLSAGIPIISLPLDALPPPNRGMERHLSAFIALRGLDRLLARQDLDTMSSEVQEMIPSDKAVSKFGHTYTEAYHLYNRRAPDARQVSPADADFYRQALAQAFKQQVPQQELAIESYWLSGGSYSGPREIIGRVYFSLEQLTARQAARFFAKLVAIDQNLQKLNKGVTFKMVADRENFSRADGAVLYFSARDQEEVYAELRKLYQACPAYFKPVIPHFTAQLLNSKGHPMTGIAFGQEPLQVRTSFGGKRAMAMTNANRELRRRINAGDTLTRGDAFKIMIFFLEKAGVDIESPAFDLGKRELFTFIALHSDQPWAGIKMPTQTSAPDTMNTSP